MDTSSKITASIFIAHLNCPTKAYLIAHDEKAPSTFFADTRDRISVAYKRKAIHAHKSMPIDFSQLSSSGLINGFVDCETLLYRPDQLAQAGHRSRTADPGRRYTPLLYSAWNKSDHHDDLLVSFGALGIAQAAQTAIPLKGRVIYGEQYHCKTVTIGELLPKTHQLVRSTTMICSGTEPPKLVLNEHCQVCDFQYRCRRLAVERDDLSLLHSMNPKERLKSQEREKGAFRP